MLRNLTIGCAAALIAATVSVPAQAVTLFGVDVNNNLISFDSAAPGATVSSIAISGIAGASVLAMDIRVADGMLYALTDDKRLYTVNRGSGAASLFANLSALTGTQFAFDFNPANTNLRIVSNDSSNYVYNFATNTLMLGTNVAYASGGPASQVIAAAAYLNNDNDSSTATTLYVIDSANDLLATQNPATGVLTQVGALGVDFQTRSSFDIFTSGAANSAFGYNGNTLYSINLTSGAATSLGNTDRPLFALTTTAPVPEPATWLSMIVGFGVIGSFLRKRSSYSASNRSPQRVTLPTAAIARIGIGS
jgi:hypothetical protein